MDLNLDLQIVSDLHTEFPDNKKWLEENPIIPSADVLILSGDIGYFGDLTLEYFLSDLRKKFKQIYYIPGNHEYYSRWIYIRDFHPHFYRKHYSNITILNNHSVEINGVKFIFSTLWSKVSENEKEIITRAMNDYNSINLKPEIDNINVDYTNSLFNQSFDFIKKEVDYDGKVVVVTHHLPSFQLISDKFKDSPINSGFASDLDDFIESNPQIVTWICGHSHDVSDIKIGNTRVVKNPLGYIGREDTRNFKRDFTIKI